MLTSSRFKHCTAELGGGTEKLKNGPGVSLLNKSERVLRWWLFLPLPSLQTPEERTQPNHQDAVPGFWARLFECAQQNRGGARTSPFPPRISPSESPWKALVVCSASPGCCPPPMRIQVLAALLAPTGSPRPSPPCPMPATRSFIAEG